MNTFIAVCTLVCSFCFVYFGGLFLAARLRVKRLAPEPPKLEREPLDVYLFNKRGRQIDSLRTRVCELELERNRLTRKLCKARASRDRYQKNAQAWRVAYEQNVSWQHKRIADARAFGFTAGVRSTEEPEET